MRELKAGVQEGSVAKDAQAELRACEAALEAEESELDCEKRAFLRDSLGSRMRALADLGQVLQAQSELSFAGLLALSTVADSPAPATPSRTPLEAPRLRNGHGVSEQYGSPRLGLGQTDVPETIPETDRETPAAGSSSLSSPSSSDEDQTQKLQVHERPDLPVSRAASGRSRTRTTSLSAMQIQPLPVESTPQPSSGGRVRQSRLRRDSVNSDDSSIHGRKKPSSILSAMGSIFRFRSTKSKHKSSPAKVTPKRLPVAANLSDEETPQARRKKSVLVQNTGMSVIQTRRKQNEREEEEAIMRAITQPQSSISRKASKTTKPPNQQNDENDPPTVRRRKSKAEKKPEVAPTQSNGWPREPVTLFSATAPPPISRNGLTTALLPGSQSNALLNSVTSSSLARAQTIGTRHQSDSLPSRRGSQYNPMSPPTNGVRRHSSIPADLGQAIPPAPRLRNKSNPGPLSNTESSVRSDASGKPLRSALSTRAQSPAPAADRLKQVEHRKSVRMDVPPTPPVKANEERNSFNFAQGYLPAEREKSGAISSDDDDDHGEHRDNYAQAINALRSSDSAWAASGVKRDKGKGRAVE